MSQALIELLGVLRDARKAHDTLLNTITEAKQKVLTEFRLSHAALIEQEETADEAVCQLEAQVRTEAYEIFAKTGSKQLAPGVTIAGDNWVKIAVDLDAVLTD
jgi:hypothetical protein